MLCCGGCVDRAATADRIGRAAGLALQMIDTGSFRLLSYQRIGPGHTLVVYIEGDGLAWINRAQLSEDPTPTDPVALRLAAKDDAAAVLYLARPCQFATITGEHGCEAAYWSAARYGQEAVDAVDRAISDVATAAAKSRLELVGYSGGGVIATLIAARRNDVTRVTTVAANLDVAFWTQYQKVSPLSRSLNPADFVGQLAHTPQVIFVGGRDEIVPPVVAEHYAQKFPPAAPVKIVAMPSEEHDCCWAENWPELLDVARSFPSPNEAQ